MAVILAEFKAPVVSHEGLSFRARACALSTPAGSWQAWIEFNPTNGDPTFRSPQETMQPNRVGVVQWAGGLSSTHLEAALHRALCRVRPAYRSRFAEAG